MAILAAAMEMRRRGPPEFHGFQIAKAMRDRDAARLLTAHGTLYKALGRMERAGLLESRWEDPLIAAQAERPRRRLYHVTAQGETAFAAAGRPRTTAAPAPGLAPGRAVS